MSLVIRVSPQGGRHPYHQAMCDGAEELLTASCAPLTSNRTGAAQLGLRNC